MKKVTLYLTDREYHGILGKTHLINHFIRKAVHERLKSSTDGMKNFNEAMSQKNYNVPFEGDGIILSGKSIKAHHGRAEILGDICDLDLANHQPISKVDPKARYEVVGENPQVNHIIIKQHK